MDKDRAVWVRSWYGQCVLNGSQVFWTKESEDAIIDGTLDS